MIRMLDWLERRSRSELIAAGLVLVAIIGLIDYLSGHEMLFSVFYLLAVGLAAWFVGNGFGLLISVLSVVVWIGGDLASGARYSSSLVPIWNALILLVFYFIVVWLLTSLRALHRELETRVRQRTLSLTREMAERERLEGEILKVSEREQRRIGHDLHDSLCQHLTATALAGQVLSEKLAVKSLSEAADADKIVDLVEEGITLARNMARGLLPSEMETADLTAAFQELAANLTERSRVRCEFEGKAPVLIHDDATAMHLYRIAQEAAGNAVRHGKATHIVIDLFERDGRVALTVEDNGVGLPENWQKSNGLGIRIMAHRAAMVGGSLSVERTRTGTIVTCLLPRRSTLPESVEHHDHGD